MDSKIVRWYAVIVLGLTLGCQGDTAPTESVASNNADSQDNKPAGPSSQPSTAGAAKGKNSVADAKEPSGNSQKALPAGENGANGKAEQAERNATNEETPSRPQVEPASFTQIKNAVDLRKVPIPDDGSFSRRTVSEMWLRLERTVPETVAFVREQLEKQGCEEIDPLFPMEAPHVALAFEKEGVLVTAFVTPESDTAVADTNCTITTVGNVDARELIQFDDGELKDGQRSNVQWVTSKSVPDAIAEARTKLEEKGWQLFQDPTNMLPSPTADPQNYTYIKNGIITRVYATANAAFGAGDKTTVLVSFQIVGAELPLPPEPQGISLNTLKGQLRYESKMTLADSVEFYRQRFAQLNWQPGKPSRVEEERAHLRFQLGNDITLVNATSFDGGTKIELIGLIEKRPEDEVRAQEREEAKELAKDTNPVALPLPESAADIQYSDNKRDVTFTSSMTTKELVEFYRTAFTEMGWNERRQWTNLTEQNGNMSFDDGADDAAFINCFKLNAETPTSVSANANGFVWEEAAATASHEKAPSDEIEGQ